MNGVQIIVLNGPGSAGKTSIARALQEMTAEPFLHVAMDAFLDMLPQSLWGHSDGFLYRPGPDGTEILPGPVAQKLLEGMRASVAALAGAGNRLIIDEVMQGAERDEYQRLLAGIEARWVGVTAPLPVLEARERARGDREAGLARWQCRRVHEGMSYDLMVDTGLTSAEDCAGQIRAVFGL